MAVEYRPARPEEMRQFVYSSRLGFGGSTSDAEVERVLGFDELRPEWTLCAFDDGELASQMATFPFVMRWNGRDIGCGGVTAVSTLPTHRRRGHLRELMTRSFVTMREAGQPVAMLWASMTAIYQRFGYGIAYTRWRCDFDPRQLRFVDQMDVPGRVRLVKIGESQPVIADAYAQFAAPRTLMLQRNADWWHASVLRQWRPEAPPRLVAVYEEAGRVLGYTIYSVERHGDWRPGPDQRLDSGELVWLTPAAHRGLVRYLAGYDLVDSINIWRMPVDDPLFHHAQEPRLLDLRAYDGTLVRLVDVQRALEGRGYDADGRLTLMMPDDLCPWNTGAWEMTVAGGVARLKRTEAEPDLCLAPRALAILVSGHQSATMLARSGLIPPADARALATADALFRTTHAPLCLDGF